MLQSLKWRFDLYRKRKFLEKNFVNSDALFQSLIHKTACDTAILKDKRVIRHPPGLCGFSGMILEIMHRQVYTGSFYCPKPDDVIIDAGANVGLFSMHVFSLCPQARIVAFEPFPVNFQFLNENLTSFGATGVDARQCALGKERNTVFIQRGGDRSQDHRVSDAELPIDQGFPVPSKSLKNTIEEFAGEEIALFKCDIEGGEADLFEGSDPSLLSSVKRFAIEFHDNIKPNVSQMLLETLKRTHRAYTRDVSPCGYGMLYAIRRDLR